MTDEDGVSLEDFEQKFLPAITEQFAWRMRQYLLRLPATPSRDSALRGLDIHGPGARGQ